jgi:hypothetical protein
VCVLCVCLLVADVPSLSGVVVRAIVRATLEKGMWGVVDMLTHDQGVAYVH